MCHNIQIHPLSLLAITGSSNYFAISTNQAHFELINIKTVIMSDNKTLLHPEPAKIWRRFFALNNQRL